jgi:N-ethylmaleimide reductase
MDMPLFQPDRIGALVALKRIVMAPSGRARNDFDTREGLERAVNYHVQRATVWLFISKAMYVLIGSVSRTEGQAQPPGPV